MNKVPENANKGCIGPGSANAGKVDSCNGCPNQSACSSGKGTEKDPAISLIAECLNDIKHIILVMSGKGGVGKSTVCSQLAWLLSTKLGKKVGVLDVDICGPSIPKMFGVENEEIHKSNCGWMPVYVNDNLSVMSVGFMLNSKNDAVIWRGPRKNGLIKQFLTEVDWEDLDYLLIDTPPGTSDEHISVIKYLEETNTDGAIIVTTPQEVSLIDVRKELTFCKKVNMNVLGVVENMSYFQCPCCNTNSNIFAAAGGAITMCQEFNVNFLGSLPIDTKLAHCGENGKSYFDKNCSFNNNAKFSSLERDVELVYSNILKLICDSLC